MEGYEAFFTEKLESRDIGYASLALLFNSMGYDVIDLFKFHIVLIGLFFSLFFYKLKAPSFILLVIILTNYVAVGNQIRFYLALPLGYFSMYYLLQRKYFLFVLCSTVAVVFHFTLLIFIGLFLLCYLLQRVLSIYQMILLSFIINAVIYVAINHLGAFNEKYTNYFDSDSISSVAGGIYILLPYIIIGFYVLYLIWKILDAEEDYINEVWFKFVYSTTFVGVSVILISIYLQIFAHRFIFSLLPLWLFFFMEVNKVTNNEDIRFTTRYAAVIMLPLIVFYIYILPYMIGMEPFTVNEQRQMLESYTW
jgi:hypothetical protein